MKGLNGHFTKEIQMTGKHMIMCSVLLIIKKCKLKPQWYNITHSLHWQNLKNKKSVNINCWSGYGSMENYTLLKEVNIGTAIFKMIFSIIL